MENPANVSTLRGWYLAARPATLPAAVAPVLVGVALAIGNRAFHPVVLAATLLAALLIQIGANLANDLFDFYKGADTAERLGPTRVTQSGIFKPQQVALATALVFAAALLLGCYLATVGGLPIVLIGLLSILSAIAYTGGPYPLGYHGLGDLFVFVFFGVIAVTGSYYLQTHQISFTVFVASVPIGLLCTNILVVNNLRDVDTDRVAGKRTMAVRMGRAATRRQYALFMLIAYTLPLTLWQLGASSIFLFWLPLLTVPRAVRLALYVSTKEGRDLNLALKETAALHMQFGLLFAISLLH